MKLPILFACAMTVPALAAPPDAEAARTFVQKLYAHYPQKGHFFEPTGKDAGRVFDPGLIAAFREDTRLAKGEVGFVDSDPVCDCQDDDGMTAKIASVTMTGADSADVVMRLAFPDSKPIPQTLHLVVVRGQWRIHDITTPDEKSFRADLLKANAEATHRR